MNRFGFTTPFLAMLCLLLAPANASEQGSKGSAGSARSEEPSANPSDENFRVLIPYSLTYYFVEKGTAKGIAADYIKDFEAFAKKQAGEKTNIEVTPTPVERDGLLSGIIDGDGEIAIGGLTISEPRSEHVAFSRPLLENVDQFIVSSDATPIADLAGLSGLSVHARKSSSHYKTLISLNERLKSNGLKEISIQVVPEDLEDEDLLEMVQVGIYPAIVMDDYRAKLWAQHYDQIYLHSGFALREKEQIGWALRQDRPRLEKLVNEFLQEAKPGSRLQDVGSKRYFSNIRSLVNPNGKTFQGRFEKLQALFQKHGAQHRIPANLLAAQAFQESHLEQSARSGAGAVGIMQLLPSTARDRNVGISDIYRLENNIEAGAKYMRFLADHYFGDPEIDPKNQLLFALAAYNLGPERIVESRKTAPNPNQWFGSVEWEVARKLGLEPVRYVKNIYIYYLVYSEDTGISPDFQINAPTKAPNASSP